MDQFERTRILIGEENLSLLRKSRVAVFGVGGVGGYAVEALARCGIGALDLIDNDRVSLSNLNRQIIATEDTIGKYKVDAAAERIRKINPGCTVRCFKAFFLPENAAEFDFSEYQYVIDAVDTVSAKIQIVLSSKNAGTPVISSMGAGNKMDPTAFRVADLYETSVCPLARVMRTELRKRGVKELKVVYSEETPITPYRSSETDPNMKRSIPGSCSFVPAVAGLIAGGEVIRDLIGIYRS